MYLQIAYIALTIAVLIGILVIGFKTINKTFSDREKAKKKKTMLVVGLVLWQVYMLAIAYTGILETFELPPRFPVFLIFPVFLFTGVFIYKNRNNQWIQNIKPEVLINFQAFRILVETIFVFSVSAGILIKNVTIEGYNFDMIFAFTAPVITYLVFKRKTFSQRTAIYWNYLGLAVLVSVIFVFISSIYFPNLYGWETTPMPIEFAKYPYVLVAGFLMPSAVFFHVLSIVQLNNRS